jgi:predicted RNA-binding protein with PUA-like domain
MKWLFKTEPSEYSFERLVRDGRTTWDGVKNALALRHLGAVRKGDEIAVYHTGGVKAVVGVARAAADAKAGAVEIVPVRPAGPVPLSSIKSDPRFREFPLVRMGRLSVMPVPEPLWKALTRNSQKSQVGSAHRNFCE